MLIKTLPVGHLETNCYVVTDENTLECAVIDPGAESNTILGYIEDNHLKCRAVMLTHAHFDHVGALGAVMKETGARCYVNRREEGTGVTGLRDFRPPEDSVFYGEGDTVQVGSLTFRVMETPGHTPGGICLVGEGTAEGIAFVGDTLFPGSCGRTDLAGGDPEAMRRSLARMGREIAPQTVLLCGHGPATTMAEELSHNPFVR